MLIKALDNRFYVKCMQLEIGLFCENEQAWTKWIIICSEENTYLDAQGSYGRS